MSPHILTRASIVHIDCDFYESSKAALDFCTNLVDDGSVLVFDDFNFYRGKPELGERRALQEWLAENQHVQAVELARQGFGIAFFLRVAKPS